MNGYRIRLARLGVGYTQAQLAKECGFSERSLKRWEKGEGEPLARNLAAIMRVTGKPHEFFHPDADDEEAALVAEQFDDALRNYIALQVRIVKESGVAS